MVVILCACSAYRTALCKAKRGGFKDTHPDDILAPVLKVFLLLISNSFATLAHNSLYNVHPST
jgi:hypothetical protein